MATYDLGPLGEVSGAWEALDATIETLKVWVPAIVQKVNQAGYIAADGPLAQPKFYGKLNPGVIDRVADQVPAVMASSPGSTSRPIRVGQTGWATRYVVNVTVVDRAQDFETTSERIQLWAGLIRQVMLGNKTLRGRVQEVLWTGETFGAIPDTAGRTYAGCTVSFTVQLPINALADFGQLTPDPVYPDPTGEPDPIPDTVVITDFEELK
jgi:hypothetical protein